MRRLGVPQPLLSVLGAAQHGGGRLGILAEVLHAGRRDHGYLASREELTPPAHDPKALVPLAMATAATVAVPRSWSWFTSGSVSNYALTGEGWHQLLEFDPSLRYDRKGSGPGPTKARRSRRTGTELEVGRRADDRAAGSRFVQAALGPTVRGPACHRSEGVSPVASPSGVCSHLNSRSQIGHSL